ncbi:hypothetical protein CgunFtcFv8_023686 [Champsocephalus gunnari]|uniref:Receptor-type tyrosine-protein phosphatase F n=1 Tax=Champsocephalus gunnari TaxID=52237 RepID=A0AAN8HLN8_CHAGU|nr:hypothetical protein CgunFtcFv8_023686 [Champsocephalus gunnari]
MVPNIHLAAPLVPRGALLFLLLLTCLVFSSHADSMPSFVKSPEDQTGISGGVASFVCLATGEPKPRITWMKKGKKVSSQRFEVIEFDDGSGSVLRIQPLRTHRDEAIYECKATNSVGEIDTSAKLTVLEETQIPHGFPTIDMGPQLKVVEKTRTATMLCAASGNPDPEITWYKDMLPVDISSSNGRIKQLRSGALQIEISEESDQGKYECVALNSAGTRYSSPANLYVRVRRVPPRFSIPPTNQEVMPGGSVNLTCVAVGSPMPYVKWKTGETDITKEEDMPMGRNVLEVIKILVSANYTCVAISPLGMIEATAQVTVKALPKPPASLIVTETTATSVTLTWDSGNPEPVSYYMIQYKAKSLENGFQEVEGDGPPSDVLQVKTQQGVPAQPSSFEADAELDNRIMLTWLWPVQDPITKYELEYWESGSETKIHVIFDPAGSYAVDGLKPDTSYRFSLAARSEMGLGVFTQPIEARTAQSTPSAPPQDVHLVSLSSTSLKVSWVAPPAASRHGAIVRYTVSYQAMAGEDTERHEVPDIGTDASSLLLEGLEKWTEYQVWVRAHTDVGPGPESAPVRMKTREDVPGAPPRRLEVEAINSTAIRVTWKPPLQGKQHGQIRGYQVIFSRLENGEPRGQPNIMDVALPEAQWNIEESTEHEAIIAGLHSETTYSVTVAAYTTKGDGARSKAKVITTTGAVPGKPNMMISTTSGTTSGNTALIQWQPPKEMVGELMGFQLQYKRTDEETYTSRELRKTEEHYTVTGLHKGATYVFRLSARNRAGIGEAYTKEIGTAEDVPSGFPFNLQVTGLTQSSTQLTWEPPLVAERNGKIVYYLVVYRDINSQQNSTNRTSDTHMTIHGLNPDTTYDIRVQAFTSKGGGPLSPSIQSRTMSIDFPTLNFGVKAVMKTSVLLTWDLPANYKSQVPFKILYNQQSVEVQGNLKRKLISQLQPDTDYSFVLTSRGNIAGGLQQQVSIRTAPDLIKTKPNPLQAEGGKMTINLPKVQTTTRVRWYYIVVMPVSPSTPQWKNPDEMDLDELLKSSEGPALRRRRHLDSSKPYIAAKLASLPTSFIVGDEKMNNGFYNKPLAGAQKYLFFVLAVLRNEGTDGTSNYMTFSASPYSDPIQVSTSMTQDMEQPEMLWVMGPVLAVVLIILIVIAILLFKKKRASPLPKDEQAGGVKDSLLANSSDPVEMRRLNYQTPGMREHPPIPVTDLADHIERLKANDGLRFSQEYESVDPGQQFTWENSNMEVNKPKNRYANVIAYDHSRVVLTSVDGKGSAVPGSDYINANYIDGYRKQNAYIATQGPLPETLSDFWRMVWEQRSNTIVMMTRLEEKSRVKCDQYWPSRGTETYGMIQVTMLDTVELATYSVRTFALYKNGSSEKRELRQFQFMAWPDHGVPEYPTPILAFLRRVKACNPPDAGPHGGPLQCGGGQDWLLHRDRCHAGAHEARETEDQYIFIHEALLEAATCGNTEVPARNLYAHIQKLTQPPPGETVTAMELEFKRLANSKAHTSRFISANLPCNKFKNRLVNIMPFESTRVCLQPIRGVEGSDYINASCIDGYRQQKAYLATQGPLAETTEDFWRMLWEHNSTIVVMLTKLREMGREKCHQYWPAERSARYQYFVVDPMAEYNMPQYILREFKVTDARDGQSRTIRQFQFTDWPEQGVPKTGEGFIDFIGQVHKTKEQFGQDGPITVHCSAGVGRTGVFITLSIVLERMRYEGVVDLFQTVKTLRTQRPAMVQTEDQYQLCYRAALEYLGSFDHYAT